MSSRPSSRSNDGPFRALAVSLRLGALYDVSFAVAMLVAPGLLARGFSLPLPSEPFYLRLIAVLLAMVAFTYLVAARDPSAHRALVAIAILGRVAGFLALALSAAGEPHLAGLWGPAFVDLGFALFQAVTGRRLWR